MANAAGIQITREVRQTFAGPALTERQAKLYSQRLRRAMGHYVLARRGNPSRSMWPS
jgi:hypothetical protein